MSMQVDWTRCDGHGLCAALLPGAIGRDEWGYPVLDQAAVARRPAAEVRRAVACCPALALRLEPAGAVR
ncbi:MAG TPA: ferredoxin [Jatrophihabitans sp.]|nr:ferredoxin [Jatrophihabitans sp.]